MIVYELCWNQKNSLSRSCILTMRIILTSSGGIFFCAQNTRNGMTKKQRITAEKDTLQKKPLRGTNRRLNFTHVSTLTLPPHPHSLPGPVEANHNVL